MHNSMLTEKELQVLQRRARGESQQEIARALKISQAAISKFETNAHRKILEAQQLLKATQEIGIGTEEGLAGKHVIYRKQGGA